MKDEKKVIDQLNTLLSWLHGTGNLLQTEEDVDKVGQKPTEAVVQAAMYLTKVARETNP